MVRGHCYPHTGLESRGDLPTVAAVPQDFVWRMKLESQLHSRSCLTLGRVRDDGCGGGSGRSTFSGCVCVWVPISPFRVSPTWPGCYREGWCLAPPYAHVCAGCLLTASLSEDTP